MGARHDGDMARRRALAAENAADVRERRLGEVQRGDLVRHDDRALRHLGERRILAPEKRQREAAGDAANILGAGAQIRIAQRFEVCCDLAAGLDHGAGRVAPVADRGLDGCDELAILCDFHQRVDDGASSRFRPGRLLASRKDWTVSASAAL